MNKFKDVLKQHTCNIQSEIIINLSNLVRDHYDPSGHMDRVTKYTLILANGMNFSEENLELLKVSSLMHDIGKIGIPMDILTSDDLLTKEEYAVVKEHSRIGYNIFKNSEYHLFKMTAQIAHEHHERWDGSGYPQGLSGSDISLVGRIVAVADVYDALRTARPYKKEWSIDEVNIYFRNESGKSFDPDVIECYFKHKELFR